VKVLELFAGTKSISNVFAEAGHETFSIDWDNKHPNIDWYTDISKITAEDILQRFGQPSIIWASPDCTTYSVAAISKHREREPNGNLKAKSEYAKFCDECNRHLIQVIHELNPKYWFIENPRGALRKMDFMQALPRYTVTYCKYGERRQKPTDIFTNHPAPDFIPICKRGEPCHDSAPRGAKTGSQAIKNKVEKSKIPVALCKHILDICTR
jgi:site-specific DNA-cytosine methylase